MKFKGRQKELYTIIKNIIASEYDSDDLLDTHISMIVNLADVVYKRKAQPKFKAPQKDIEEVYKAYPTKCVSNQRVLGKSSKDKSKINSLLEKYSKDDLLKITEEYISDCRSNDIYMKNYSTFLNNIPDSYLENASKEGDKKEVEYRGGYRDLRKITEFQ